MTSLLVTVVSGFTGTGRTTVARRLAAAAAGPAVVVGPDDDLATALEQAGSGRVIAERPAGTDPLGLVEAFAAAGTDHAELPAHARLTDLVTVVDADDFPRQWSGGDLLTDLGLDDGEEPGRTVTELLTDQVELATLVVVNRSDLVTAWEADQVAAVARTLNPAARVTTTAHGAVDHRLALRDEPLDLGAVQHMPGWAHQLDGFPLPGDEAHGLGGFVFRARRPFHPERLWELLHDRPDPGLLRAHGHLWLASRPDETVLWSQAGGSCRIAPVGNWWDATPEDEWPDDPVERMAIDLHWDVLCGDRRVEIALSGFDLDEQQLVAALQAALVTDEEIADGTGGQPDPFPWPETGADEHDHLVTPALTDQGQQTPHHR